VQLLLLMMMMMQVVVNTKAMDASSVRVTVTLPAGDTQHVTISCMSVAESLLCIVACSMPQVLSAD